MVGVFLFIPQSYRIHTPSSHPVGDNLTSLPTIVTPDVVVSAIKGDDNGD